MSDIQKKILLTGANGLLGQKTAEVFAKETDHELLLADLAGRAEEPRKYSYISLDITNKEKVKSVVN